MPELLVPFESNRVGPGDDDGPRLRAGVDFLALVDLREYVEASQCRFEVLDGILDDSLEGDIFTQDETRSSASTSR